MLADISVWKLLILLGVCLAVFGTKRLRSAGGDLGSAIRGFRSALHEDDTQAEAPEVKRAEAIEHKHRN